MNMTGYTAKFLALLIAVTFIINFGPQSGAACSGASGPAIVSEDLQISRKEYNRTLGEAFNQRRRQDKGFDSEKATAEKFYLKVAKQMVDARLLSKEAERRGFVLSDDELSAFLRAYFKPIMKDGVWDQTKYKNYVEGNNNMSPAAFETELRQQHAARKLNEAIDAMALPSKIQLMDLFRLTKTRAKFTAVKIDRTLFQATAGEVSDADAKAYAEANEAAIKTFYDKNKAGRFEKGKEVQARHILAKFDKEKPETEAAAKAKINAARKALAAGDDFAETAKKFSEDGSASKGGDLGKFGSGRMVKPFEEVAFKLKAGEVSDLVTTRFGYHIIKVEAVEEASTTPLADVRHEIASELAQKERVSGLAKAHAKALQARVVAGAHLADLLSDDAEKNGGYDNALKLKAEDTGMIGARQRYVTGMGVVPGTAARLLKQKEPGACSEIVTTESGFAVCEMLEREEPKEEEFAKQAEDLKMRLSYARSTRMRQALSNELRGARKIVVDPTVVGSGTGGGR
jgi:peptidyl-prolyl cis-trans isomerase D